MLGVGLRVLHGVVAAEQDRRLAVAIDIFQQLDSVDAWGTTLYRSQRRDSPFGLTYR